MRPVNVQGVIEVWVCQEGDGLCTTSRRAMEVLGVYAEVICGPGSFLRPPRALINDDKCALGAACECISES